MTQKVTPIEPLIQRNKTVEPRCECGQSTAAADALYERVQKKNHAKTEMVCAKCGAVQLPSA
jgi:predicted SprT family Zn-dependent metalloprotease